MLTYFKNNIWRVVREVEGAALEILCYLGFFIRHISLIFKGFRKFN